MNASDEDQNTLPSMKLLAVRVAQMSVSEADDVLGHVWIVIILRNSASWSRLLLLRMGVGLNESTQ